MLMLKVEVSFGNLVFISTGRDPTPEKRKFKVGKNVQSRIFSFLRCGSHARVKHVITSLLK